MSVLQCLQVQKKYGSGANAFLALSGLNCSFEEGDFTALVGPSGSGKTTLLNLLGGLDRPSAGKILLEGEDLTSLSSRQLSKTRLHKIGFIFQAYNLIPVLTAWENVEFILKLQGIASKERRERSANILSEMGLGDKMKSRPGELSGGQQQRVAIARAIVSNPAIVLADEPTANLDSKTGEKLIESLVTLNRTRKTTFIISTHDKMVVEHAKATLPIKDGQIQAVSEWAVHA